MAMSAEERREHCRKIASKGGKATAAKPGHMSAIGKRGFMSLAERFGDDGAAVSFIQGRGGMPKLPADQWRQTPRWTERESVRSADKAYAPRSGERAGDQTGGAVVIRGCDGDFAGPLVRNRTRPEA